MIRNLLLLTLLAFPALAAESDAVMAVLDAQVEAWNRGDLEGFMKGYENSGGTTFVGTEVLHGYDEMLARYKKTYGGPDGMGVLTFSDREVRLLGTDHAVVLGRFVLKSKEDGSRAGGGLFSVVLAKRPTGWLVIHDHTTAGQ